MPFNHPLNSETVPVCVYVLASSTMEQDITKIDIFDFLGLTELATEQEVKRAYRRKVLTCHPDKTDDPKAVDLFRRYTKAAEVLLDPAARAAYERVLKARKERDLRNRQLDGARKKFKQDLEAREKASATEEQEEADENARLEKEIQRLRREGCRELERQNQEIKKQIAEELSQKHQALDNDGHRIKIKWKKEIKVDMVKLEMAFRSFGPIREFVVSSKGGSALIVFEEEASINSAIASPLATNFSIKRLESKGHRPPSQACFVLSHSQNNLLADEEPILTPGYETMVLNKLRQKALEIRHQQHQQQLMSQMYQPYFYWSLCLIYNWWPHGLNE